MSGCCLVSLVKSKPRKARQEYNRCDGHTISHQVFLRNPLLYIMLELDRVIPFILHLKLTESNSQTLSSFNWTSGCQVQFTHQCTDSLHLFEGRCSRISAISILNLGVYLPRRYLQSPLAQQGCFAIEQYDDKPRVWDKSGHLNSYQSSVWYPF